MTQNMGAAVIGMVFVIMSQSILCAYYLYEIWQELKRRLHAQ